MGKKRKANLLEPAPSPLRLLLLEEFAFGRLSAAQVQKMASAAVRSCKEPSPDLASLQMLGGQGTSAQNCHRDLMKMLNVCRAPESTLISTPVSLRDKKSGGAVVESKQVPLLLPHEWFDVLEKNDVLEMFTATWSIKTSELLIGCLPKSANAGSWPALWDKICESLTLLASRHKAVVMALVGDLEFFSQEFGWPTANSNNLCPYCKCDNLFKDADAVAPFNDFRASAEWRKQPRDPRENDHPLFKVPGINFWSPKLDVLHMLDLGVSSHLYGNLINDILEDHLPGSFAASIGALNSRIQELYESQSTPAAARIPKLSKGNIQSQTGYPCLSHVKGRRIREFSSVAVGLADLYKDTVAGKHRLEAVKAMDEIYELCDCQKYRFDRKEHRSMEKAIDRLLLHYTFLSRDAFNRGKKRYSVTQKFHLMAHFHVQCKWMAPRLAWTYGPESFMSVCKKIAASCDRGTPSYQIPLKICGKFALAYELLLRGWLNLDEDEE
ncbi:unnamed protein product [Symbiodinium sp. CCMP2592]|nr:unnamed protein product [Symbiodinium sp. CCMP2592]